MRTVCPRPSRRTRSTSPLLLRLTAVIPMDPCLPWQTVLPRKRRPLALLESRLPREARMTVHPPPRPSVCASGKTNPRSSAPQTTRTVPAWTMFALAGPRRPPARAIRIAATPPKHVASRTSVAPMSSAEQMNRGARTSSANRTTSIILPRPHTTPQDSRPLATTCRPCRRPRLPCRALCTRGPLPYLAQLPRSTPPMSDLLWTIMLQAHGLPRRTSLNALPARWRLTKITMTAEKTKRKRRLLRRMGPGLRRRPTTARRLRALVLTE